MDPKRDILQKRGHLPIVSHEGGWVWLKLAVATGDITSESLGRERPV